MKKLIFAATAVLTISASAYVYTHKQNAITLNDLGMDNVEALANEEAIITCGRYEGQCWAIESTTLLGKIRCYFTGYQGDFCLFMP